MANYLEAITIHSGEVDYGMNPLGIEFDVSGRFFSPDRSRGLTCATFISAVFQSAGFPIVDLTTWPARSNDAAWRSHVIELLSSNGQADRAKQIAKEDVPFRLMPAEAAVAAAAESVPLAFELAVKLSAPLIEELFVV